MIALIRLDYSANTKINEMDRERWEDLRTKVPQLDMSEWKEDVEKRPYFWHNDSSTPIDLLIDGPVLAEFGLEFTVRRFKGTYKSTSTANVAGTHYHLHVAIPAVGLLSMDEVVLLSDACTDELQGMLTTGWRIIAVCPPDAQRRPDYILGRSPAMRES